MNPKTLFALGLLSWSSFLIQQSLAVFDGGASIALVGGSLVATSSTATATWAAGPAILAGLLLAKVVGLGIFSASRRGHRGHGNGRRRGRRDVDDNAIDMNLVTRESEAVFRQLEETDPAHCFRRYVCGLSSGLLDANNSDHVAILNLISNATTTTKSLSFEYGIAASVGETFGSLDVCEKMYDCPMTGKDMDFLLF